MLGIDITNSGGGSKILLELFFRHTRNVKILKIKPRFKFLGIEWIQRDVSIALRQFSKVFYFSNIGPLLPFQKHESIVFVQNVLLVKSAVELKGLLTIRYKILRVLFGFGIRNADIIIVQSRFLKDDLVRVHGICEGKIEVCPFYSELVSCGDILEEDFVFYPSGYGKHKGFEVLADLWRDNANLPLLKVCLSNQKFLELFGNIDGVKNIGVVNRDTVIKEIEKCSLVVYPSRFESLGLGLLESVQLGKKIVVNDRDYSREFVRNASFFDGSKEHLYSVIQKELGKKKGTSELLISNRLEDLIKIIKE